MKSPASYSGSVKMNENSVTVSVDAILKSLQVPADKADDYLLDLIGSLGERCRSIGRPQASYTVYDNPVFYPNEGLLELEGFRFSTGKIVTGALKQSTKITFFICTIGGAIEQLSKQFIREGLALEGYIVDLIGSEFAEGIAETVHQAIGTEMQKNNLKITNRYSPGYCNWPVSDQQYLFPLLENTCGVELKPSSLMIPIKSVSGVIGIGPDVKFRGYACSQCDASFCIYRDKK